MSDAVPIIEEIKQEYKELRLKGNSRAEASEKLMDAYRHELNDSDDGPLFWIGIAAAQVACRELSQEASEMGLKALKDLQNTQIGELLGSRQIAKYWERFAQPPMPERRKITEKKRFQCAWRIGDVFAYKIKGVSAERLGISGKYMLLRKVDTADWSRGETHPVVTFTYWDRPELPKTAEEFQTVMPLRVACGRHGYPINLYEYRIDILFKRSKQLDDLELCYLGNFPDVPAPADEVIVKQSGSILMANPVDFDNECSLYYNLNLLIKINSLPVGRFFWEKYRKYINPSSEVQNIGCTDDITITLENAKRLLLKKHPDNIEEQTFAVYYDTRNYCWLVEKMDCIFAENPSECVMFYTNGDVLSVFSCPKDPYTRWG